MSRFVLETLSRPLGQEIAQCVTRAAARLLAIPAFVALTAALSVVPASALETFTLPQPAPGAGIYYPDLQTAFPQVDWSGLDRLYIPAGHYKFVNLGNLPVRAPENPLVITNHGGQVRVGGLGHYYNLVIGGGAHWRLTGRFDAAAATGDAAFPGHDAGYAATAGTYGLLIDDAFESEGESGLGVGGGATAFEIDFVEITGVGFAGMLIKTDSAPESPMDDVYLHDNYIHDVGSEGIYLGSTQSQPQHTFDRLRVVNNRVVRTGTEALQLGQLGEDCEIANNVFVFGAIGWKNPFQSFQDNAAQTSSRYGDCDIHHNLVIGGASKLLIFFGLDVAGDLHDPGDVYRVRENYFSHSRNFGVYVHSASDGTTTYRFEGNTFREIAFSYDELDPGATHYDTVFRVANTGNPVEIVHNTWHGPGQLVQAFGSNVTSAGNVEALAPPVEFVDSGFPSDFDYRRLEVWTDVDIDGDPVDYLEGDYVTLEGRLYLSIEPGSHSNKRPPEHPATWQELPMPADDLRLTIDSPYQGYGLLDNLGSAPLFADDFESGATTGWSLASP